MSKEEEKKEERNLDFYQDCIVDPNNLDKAVEKFATLLYDYGVLADDKMEEVNEQKKVLKVKDEELKEVSAKLYLKYKMGKVEGKTPTETYVQSQIEIDEEYKIKFNETIKELEKFNKLIHQSDILNTARESIRANKKMISERITLYLCGYNSDLKQSNASERIYDRLNNRAKYGDKD